jgi:hypothetical protein
MRATRNRFSDPADLPQRHQDEFSEAPAERNLMGNLRDAALYSISGVYIRLVRAFVRARRASPSTLAELSHPRVATQSAVQVEAALEP